jgi:hypothetical protein
MCAPACLVHAVYSRCLSSQMGSGDFDLRFMALRDLGAVLKAPGHQDDAMLARVRCVCGHWVIV